jgi:type I restriction enzyme, R subunit
MSSITEATVEIAVLEWFANLGFQTLHGPDISPDGSMPERASYQDVVLVERLRAALRRINPDLPNEVIEEAIRRVLRTEDPTLAGENHRIHQLLISGLPLEWRDPSGQIRYPLVHFIDFDDPHNNDWLAVNQYTVIEHANRRPDVVVFLNGLAIAVFELKGMTDVNATVRGAYNQLQTYKQDIPTLFHYNEILVASDGYEAQAGTLTADWDRFMPWRTVDGDDIAPRGDLELSVLIKGMFEKSRLLDMIRYFTVFEFDNSLIVKKLAAYHQFHAVNKAVDCTIRAASPEGDRRVGVIWHTQGSGKSLSMLFYAGKVIQHPAMENPTLVVLTDRNDLDDQLFGTFSVGYELLRQKPARAERRSDLRELLNVSSGGVVFTTIQKFLPEERGDRYPLLSERRNIVVIADEAHRSQYEFVSGFAAHIRDALPNASFIGFTGTPIELDDRNTRTVFGDYIDIYDIQRAVDDGVTVRIYYEGRLAKIGLDEGTRDAIDAEFEEVTEGEELERKEKLKTKWARLEAMVGSEQRVNLLAEDIVEHFERRLEAMDGKAMVVCMSRRICVDLYNAIVTLRPDWHNDDDKQGAIKVVMTGSASDPKEWQEHIRTKAARENIADRFKKPNDPLKLVIVRDMWLTGFDVASFHTMYVDKPMRGHGLMQAIARVNRVFRDKPGGLIVDYIGIAEQLKRALSSYTEIDRAQAGIPQETAVALLQEKYEIVRDMFHRFDYQHFFAVRASERLEFLKAATDFILSLEQGKERYLPAVSELSKAFALAVPHERTSELREEVGFLQDVRNRIQKVTVEGEREEERYDTAIQQIVSRAIAAEGVVDIYSSAGFKNPDISILSDEFLDEVQHLEHKNLALELLRKLLNQEIKARARQNLVQSRSFAEMLERTIRQYQNRSLESAQVIEELIKLAKQMRKARLRGEELGLSDEELAFYDALRSHEEAIDVLDDSQLCIVAKELVSEVRKNATIDWNLKASTRAKLRVIVKRLLRKHGFPPEARDAATITVIKQAELFDTGMTA